MVESEEEVSGSSGDSGGAGKKMTETFANSNTI
jgi:hypothetical protein